MAVKDDRRRFLAWLAERNYERVRRDYPGAVHALSLVDEYLEDSETDDEVAAVRLRQIARVVGYVSDYDAVVPDEERQLFEGD